MAVWGKPRVLLVAGIISMLLITTRLFNGFATAPNPIWIPDLPSDGTSNSSPDERPATGSEENSKDTSGPFIDSEAHKISTADLFGSHFKAVLSMPGIKMQEAKAPCFWGPAEKVLFQYDEAADWVLEDRSDAEVEVRRIEWHNFVRSGMIPWDQVEGKFTGRGIVIVAGNEDTLMRTAIILRALAKLGSRIAVEINYWDDEMSMDNAKQLIDIYPYMHFNDLSKEHNIIQIKKDGIFGINYQLKTAALINSRFAEPILLDSDNIPIVDPETLYESQEYKEYGTVFWPDIARTRPNNPAWAITNTPCRMDEYELESGQLVVDKRRFFYHLQLASWLNNQQGAYYNEFLLGDKDCFRFAWHALKTRYGRPKRWVTSVGTENDGFYCGHSFAQHHPDRNDGRVAFLHGGLMKTVDLAVMRWNREEKGGYFRNYKRAPSDEHPMEIVDVDIKFDDYSTYLPPEKMFGIGHGAMCTDMYAVKARGLDEIIPSFEKTFEEIGGYWQLDSGTI